MSDTNTLETSPDTAQPQAGGGSKKMLIIIIAVVVLIGGGGGGYFYFSGANAAAAEEHETAKKKGADESADDEEQAADDEETTSSSGNSLKSAIPDDEFVKHIVELAPFIVNLADQEQARYLRMSVSIGLGEDGKEGGAEPIFTTRVRNAMLAVLSEKFSEDVLSVEGKGKLRKELLRAAQAASSEPEVQAIYITDFIVQL